MICIMLHTMVWMDDLVDVSFLTLKVHDLNMRVLIDAGCEWVCACVDLGL